MDQSKRNKWRVPASSRTASPTARRGIRLIKFLDCYVGKFDTYVEDEYAVFVRYCFADLADAAVFRSRFEQKSDRFKLAG
jgi:hypothetical protein